MAKQKLRQADKIFSLLKKEMNLLKGTCSLTPNLKMFSTHLQPTISTTSTQDKRLLLHLERLFQNKHQDY